MPLPRALPATGSTPVESPDRASSCGGGLRIAIVADELGWHTRQLQQALRARGASSRCIDSADCRIDTGHAWHGLVLPGFGRELPDAVIVRGIAGGSFEQVTRRLGVLHALREFGVPVYNDARAIERSVDKSMTSLLLHAAGLPMPATWAIESPQAAHALVLREAAAHRCLVLKPLFGSQGKGLTRVGWVDGQYVPLPDLGGPTAPSAPTAATSSGPEPAPPAGVDGACRPACGAGPADRPDMPPDLAQDYGGVAYLQRFIEPLHPADQAPGHDYRVLVVGGQAHAAMRRVSAGWVHNVAQGARCEPQSLDGPFGADLARLAVAAARALDLDYAGVDLMPSTQGLQLIEVNGVAAWHGLQKVCELNIARALVDDLLDRKLAAAQRQRRA